MTVISVVNYFVKSARREDCFTPVEYRGHTEWSYVCGGCRVYTVSGLDIVGQDGNSLGPDYHDTFILSGMDHHEWDMESPPDRSGVLPQTH